LIIACWIFLKPEKRICGANEIAAQSTSIYLTSTPGTQSLPWNRDRLVWKPFQLAEDAKSMANLQTQMTPDNGAGKPFCFTQNLSAQQLLNLWPFACRTLNPPFNILIKTGSDPAFLKFNFLPHFATFPCKTLQ
jgi:hypothetical protein